MEIALVGLAGVVIGGGLTFLSNMFVERQRWNREAQTRWHEVRRGLYANFIQACDELQRAAVELAEDSTLGETGPRTIPI